MMKKIKEQIHKRCVCTEKLTNFQVITQSQNNLSDFLSMVQDDALEAEGCSLELKMPGLWDEWLKQEAVDGICITPKGSIFWNG